MQYKENKKLRNIKHKTMQKFFLLSKFCCSASTSARSDHHSLKRVNLKMNDFFDAEVHSVLFFFQTRHHMQIFSFKNLLFISNLHSNENNLPLIPEKSVIIKTKPKHKRQKVSNKNDSKLRKIKEN